MTFDAPDPDFEQRIRTSFARQGLNETIEYKVNFLSPGQGDRLVARGRVMKPGRTVTVCTGDVFAVREGQEKLVATMLVTIMTVGGRHRQPTSPRWCPCRRLRAIKNRLETVVP